MRKNEIKLKTTGTEQTRQTTPGKKRRESSPFRPKKYPNIHSKRGHSARKLNSPRLRFGEKVHTRAYTMNDSPSHYGEDTITECNEEPTQDCWNVGMIIRHNARHQDEPKPLPTWIIDSLDNYATVKRPYQKPKPIEFT